MENGNPNDTAKQELKQDGHDSHSGESEKAPKGVPPGLQANQADIQEEAQEPEESQDKEASQEDLSPEEINWRKFRESRAKERKEREEAERRAQEAEQSKNQLQNYLAEVIASQGTGTQQLTQAEQQQVIDLIDDEIPTGGEIKSFTKALINDLVEKKLEEKLALKQAQMDKQELPKRVAESMPDFWDVCNQENLDYLEYVAPDMAAALAGPLATPEKLTMRELKAIYQAVTKLVPNAKGANKGNRPAPIEQKPQSLSSPAASQSKDGAPHMMTEALRKQRWEEMQRAMKGLA